MQTDWGPVEVGNKKSRNSTFNGHQSSKRGLHRADLAICISKKTATHLTQLMPKIPVHIVPNSVDVEARDLD